MAVWTEEVMPSRTNAHAGSGTEVGGKRQPKMGSRGHRAAVIKLLSTMDETHDRCTVEFHTHTHARAHTHTHTHTHTHSHTHTPVSEPT